MTIIWLLNPEIRESMLAMSAWIYPFSVIISLNVMIALPPYIVCPGMKQNHFAVCSVFPSIQSVRLWVRTGRMALPERAPRRDWYLGIRPDDSPGRTGGDCRCLRWRNFPGKSGWRMGSQGDWSALLVIGKDCKRQTRTTDDEWGLQMTGKDCR